MARRGSFGRSGETQNLSMLVYQLLKEQMNSELENILTAYQTNMKAGQYDAQFNGQNVDGQFVLNYYQSMLAGFPAGSTEYETLRSRLSSFEQQYKTDVQNLVIDSMNNGTKVDFGLLGAGFENRGIDDVTLTDVRGWAESTVADLEANGDITQADKVKGAVFVAGFNVERDGKEAALENGDISYASYANWLGSQMKSALASGLTEDSEAYRSLMKLHASAKKEAKKDGEAKAAEKYDKALRGAMADVDAAAKAILEAYDGPYKDDIGRLWSSVPSNSVSPYYDLIKNLGTLKSKGGEDAQLYGSIMQSVGAGNLDELFGQAVTESNDKVSAILDEGFGATDPANASAFTVLANSLRGGGLSFLSASGIEFTSGTAKSTMDQMRTNLTQAGASFETNENGTITVRGGHPDLVLESLGGLSATLGEKGSQTYPWLADLGKGQISAAYLGDSKLAGADTTPDGVITSAELGAFFASGKLSSVELQAELGIVMDNMRGEDIPGSKLNPASLVYSFLEANYHKEALKAGSIMIVNDRGHTMITEWGDKQAGMKELLPTVVTVNGKDSIVYVKPVTIKQDNQGNYADLDPSMTNGFSVSLYRLPGNYTSKPGQMAEGYVVLTGPMVDASGSSTQQSIKLSIDDFENYTRAAFGAEWDFTAFNNPSDQGQDAFVSFTGSLAANSEIWKNIANPNSEYYIGAIPKDADKPFGPRAVPNFKKDDLAFNGTLNDNADLDKWLGNLIKDPGVLTSTAQEIANLRRGAGATFDTKDLIDAALKSGGISENLSYTTVASKIAQNPLWKTMVDSKFPTVPKVDITGNTPGAKYAAPIGGYWKSNNPDYNNPYVKKPGDPGYGDAAGRYPAPARGWYKSPGERDAAEAKAKSSGIPTSAPAAGTVTPGSSAFVSDAFRNKPEMINAQPPKIGGNPPAAKPGSTPSIRPGGR